MTSKSGVPPAKGSSVAKHPVFVVVVALLLFLSAIFGFSWFRSSAPIKAVVKLERVHLDSSAIRASNLVQITPISPDIERLAILSDDLIAKAIDRSKHARGQTGLKPLRSLVIPGEGDDEEKSVVLPKQISRHLRVAAGPNSSELEITLPRQIIEDDQGGIDVVNAMVDLYVELRNRERERQKNQVLVWADGKLAHWNENVTHLNPEGEKTISSIDVPKHAHYTDSGRLLALFTEATRSAQDEARKRIQRANNGTNDERKPPLINHLQQDFTTLARDIRRWENIETSVNQTTGPQVTDLKRSEKELVLFKDDLDKLMSSGLLDQPAAIVMLQASAVPPISLTQWALVIPASAGASIVLAIILALTVFRRSSAQHRESNILDDPYWPMNRHQRPHDA